jgi:hypothetical protein
MTLEDLRGRSGDRERPRWCCAPPDLAPRWSSSIGSRSRARRTVSAKTEPDYYANMQRVSTAVRSISGT